MTVGRKDIRIWRDTADRLVDGIQGRILEVNSNDQFAFKVERAVIFGSYVNSNCITLGDVDVGILLKDRYTNRRKQGELLAKIRMARPYHSWFEYHVWPREQVLRYIRNRSAYIGIHLIGTEEDAAVFSKDWLELKV